MKSKFKIQHDVPPPNCGIGRKNAYPFREMKIGDSFFVPKTEVDRSKVQVSACYFARRNPEYKFTVRQEEGGCRVWRIAVEGGKK